jgi:alpha-mannosidase
MGTIERGNNEPTKYEVPSHEWFDLTDKSGDFGVSILEDCKFGSDKPDDNTVRLTLLYTPGVRKSYLDQHSQDWGRHDITYAIYGHKGDWREGLTEWQGRRLNQPLRAFTVPNHAGTLGKSFSFVGLSTDQLDIRALKLAEESNEVIARVQELLGRPIEHYDPTGDSQHPTNVRLVDGQEREIPLPPDGPMSMKPFTPRAFACTFPAPDIKTPPVRSEAVKLKYNADVVSTDSNRADGAFDSAGRTIPAEMLPRQIVSNGIRFEMGASVDAVQNAVACNGQTIELPAGAWTKVHFLAAADEDCGAKLKIGASEHDWNVQSWTGFIGQWDDRVFDREFAEIDHTCDGKVIDFKPAFIKRDPIAWFCTHRHHPQKGNEAYQFSYLYRYSFESPAGAHVLTLPKEPRIKILAISVSDTDNMVATPAAPLYDDFSPQATEHDSFNRRGPLKVRHVYPPPPKPVFEGVEATAKVDSERRTDYAFNVGPPVADDYADQHTSNGVVFKFVEQDGKWKPHPRSAPVNGELPRLNDGEVSANHDDTGHSVWYDQEGRFYADLQKSVRLNSINTYSWHRSNRAPQYFSLWASNADKLPDPTFTTGKDCGWTLLGVVKTKDLGQGGIHLSSVHGADFAPLGPYRWVLWVTEDVGEGTFFTEIDIHAAQETQASAAP